jgi:DNA topoisomerase-1
MSKQTASIALRERHRASSFARALKPETGTSLTVSDDIRLFAGECTATFTGRREYSNRGHVVTLVKPDDTVLVHDADGYQPAAWLTRPTDLSVTTDADSFRITARDGDQRLRVVSHRVSGTGQFPATRAGVPVGRCPDCAGALIRADGAVGCLDCPDDFPLPPGATVTDRTCDDCGLPRLRVERGRVFDVCLDYGCDSLDDHVREVFDREWNCPDCGGDLRIKRARHLLAGCDEYPACDTAFSLPAGVIVGSCACGLPVFETASGRRCLDATCERYDEQLGDGDGPADGDSGDRDEIDDRRDSENTDDSTGETASDDSTSETASGDSTGETDTGDSNSETDTGDSNSETDTGDSNSETDTGDSTSETDSDGERWSGVSGTAGP